MPNTSKWFLLSAFVSVWLYGEMAGDVKLDAPQARVLAIVLSPSESLSLRDDSVNRVLIFRDAGQIAMKSQSGKTEIIVFKAGDARWNPSAAPYSLENTADHPIRFFEIELKNKSQGAAPVSKLDPTVVDSQHYKVEFENDQVRVLRIHYGPREKGVLHEHILNRVVCYLNDQGRTKAGDVRMAGAATHTEENAGDDAADRVAVELK